LGADNMGMPLAEPGIIGGISQVQEIVARERVDRVVLALAERRGVMPVHELTALRIQGLPVEDAHSVYARITGRILLDRLTPNWLILSDGFNKSLSLLTAKRAIDICASLFLIILASPLLLLTALTILLESGGPVLFRQERVGLGGRTFQILKFRSMKQGSEKGAPSWTKDGDPRVTRVGAFIRKYRLDELPQLLNVLRGEMSLIGPRPEVPYFCALLEREIPLFNQRHCVRPGISGWAQVRFKYGASLEEAQLKFEFDLFYIKNLSILFDLMIILETIRVVLLGKGAK
jgi:sugar transferase (PEP-CTERM system associated)